MTTETAPATGGKQKNTTHKCLCRTGTTPACTEPTDGSFHRGHDARMSSRLANEVVQGKTEIKAAEEHMRKAGGGDLLVSKMTRAVARLNEAKNKPAKEKAPKPAKAPKTSPSTDDPDAAGTAALAKAAGSKKTEDVYHGKRKYQAVVIATAGGETILRHKFGGKDCDHDLDI